LKQGSITVHKGDYVNKGDVIARCGNSGRSPVPHLHMQFQSTPQVGSKTMDFPLSYYILKENDTYVLKSYHHPQQENKVRNIELTEQLKSAFSFFPGQRLFWRVKKDNETDKQVEWEVLADIYNNTYLRCKETGARAWFKQESEMFYFTHYQGNKDSCLYYFYLGAFRVVFTQYKSLKVLDSIPANVLAKGAMLLLQDFLAPFYLFIKSTYQVIYPTSKDELTDRDLLLQSEVSISNITGKKTRTTFELHFKDDLMEKIVISEPKEKPWELLYEIPS
jgi:hypothetical protein